MPVRQLLSFPSILFHHHSSGLPWQLLVRCKTTSESGQTQPPNKKYKTEDLRQALMKRILYKTPNPKTLEMNEEEFIRHIVIHRAWQARERKERERRNADLERQYHKMVIACTELEKVNKDIYEMAMARHRHKVFPMEMRIPTETPGPWNYDWKADIGEGKSL